MKIHKKVAITFENKDVLEVEDIDIRKFITDGFKFIEREGEIVSRIIVSERVWQVFREKCEKDFFHETPRGNYIWTAEIEVFPNSPVIAFLSGDYLSSAGELVKQGVLY